MKTSPISNSISLLVAGLLAACAAEDAVEPRGRSPEERTGPSSAAQSEPDANDPALCAAQNREYRSFDQTSLTAKRAAARLGDDRARMKPFSALQSEYARVLGAAPASLTGAGNTFGAPGKNWYEEPHASAIGVQTAYTIAFDGCLDYTKTDAAFAAAPDATSAAAQCSAMVRRFWSRIATPQEVQACADMATAGAAAEPDPRRRWAYACASVLSSAGFMTY